MMELLAPQQIRAGYGNSVFFLEALIFLPRAAMKWGMKKLGEASRRRGMDLDLVFLP